MTIKIKPKHKEYHIQKHEWKNFEEQNDSYYLTLVHAKNDMIFNEKEYIKHVLKKDGTLIIHSHDIN